MRRRNAYPALLVALLSVLPAVINVTAAAAPPGATQPTGPTVTATAPNEAVLAWDPADGALSYRVLWGVTANEMIVLDETTGTTYTHSYLAPGSTYVYAVQTVTRRGISAPSAVVSVTTPPDPPTFLSAEVIKADEVQLTWTPGYGATSYEVTFVEADGTETPAVVLSGTDRGALVRTVAATTYQFRVRSVANAITSLTYASVSVTTPPREPSVINVTAPSPLPAGDTVITFQVSGTQTLQPTSGTLDVSIDGGPATQVVVQWSTASLPVNLEPGTHTLDLAYSGDGAFLPSTAQWTIQVAPALPAFAGEMVISSSEVYAVAAADVTCDGRLDLITASAAGDGSGSRLDVRPGLADGTFGPALATGLPPGTASFSLATGDLDRDGCADVATVLDSQLWIFEGSTAGLSAGTRVRGADQVYDVELADMTGDGLLDAVYSDGGGVSMLPGNARGGFGRATRLVTTGPGSFTIGDLDGDGRLDLVTMVDGRLQAWGQSATGQFTQRWTVPVAAGPVGVSVDDITGDGAAEVAVTANGTVEVLAGADGRLVASVPGGYWAPQLVATGDLDGDGLADIVSVDGYSGGLAFSLTWAGAPTAQQYVFPDPWLSAVRDGGLLVLDATQDGRTDVVVLDGYGVRVLRQG